MTRFYMKREPGPRENVGALAVTLGVAAATFYVVRAFLSREPLESGASADSSTSALPAPKASDEDEDEDEDEAE